MVAKILTISIPQEDMEYLNDNPLLSPSKIFQVALNNLREQRKNFDEEIKRLQHANRVLQNKLLEATDGRNN